MHIRCAVQKQGDKQTQTDTRAHTHTRTHTHAHTHTHTHTHTHGSTLFACTHAWRSVGVGARDTAHGLCTHTLTHTLAHTLTHTHTHTLTHTHSHTHSHTHTLALTHTHSHTRTLRSALLVASGVKHASEQHIRDGSCVRECARRENRLPFPAGATLTRVRPVISADRNFLEPVRIGASIIHWRHRVHSHAIFPMCGTQRETHTAIHSAMCTHLRIDEYVSCALFLCFVCCRVYKSLIRVLPAGWREVGWLVVVTVR